MTNKIYKETVITEHHAGFGMYEAGEYNGDGWSDKQDLLLEIRSNVWNLYILGKDELPEDIFDIRGKIYNEPGLVFATENEYGIQYGGIEEFEEEEANKMTNWKKLALENEGQIKDKMREAFKESIGDITDSWQYSVILDEDGDAEVHFLSQNSTTTGIFNGEATEICRFTRFSLGDLDMDWHMENYLEDDEKEKFEAWKEETGLDAIEDWNEEVYSRIEEERRQDYIDNYMEDDIESKWDGFFEMLDNN